MNLMFWIVSPVAHFRHVHPPRVEMTFVSFYNYGIFAQFLEHLSRLISIHPTIIIAASLDIFSFVIQPMKPYIRHNNVFIMRDEVFDDRWRCMEAVDVAPVDPAMMWF